MSIKMSTSVNEILFPSTGTPDVRIKRTLPGTLAFDDNGSGNIVVNIFGTLYLDDEWCSNLNITNSILYNNDLSLYRSAAKTLKLDDGSGGTVTMDVNGTLTTTNLIGSSVKVGTVTSPTGSSLSINPDGGYVIFNYKKLSDIDEINSRQGIFGGVTGTTGTFGSSVSVDTINEKTSAAGVIVDSLQIKDGTQRPTESSSSYSFTNATGSATIYVSQLTNKVVSISFDTASLTKTTSAAQFVSSSGVGTSYRPTNPQNIAIMAKINGGARTQMRASVSSNGVVTISSNFDQGTFAVNDTLDIIPQTHTYRLD